MVLLLYRFIILDVYYYILSFQNSLPLLLEKILVFLCGSHPFPTLNPRDLSEIDQHIRLFLPATLIYLDIGTILFTTSYT